ncbi:MAG: hypothetical protein ACAI38_11510 [Myxococcota bacterium]|nr:hypothetical protein [Myxococcota bacterium]
MPQRPHLLAVVLLLLAGPAQATVLADWTLEERIAHSDSVVAGTITAQRVTRVGDDIVTESTVVVSRTLFGPERRELTVSQLGGTIGETTLHVEGSAHFEVGDEVVLIVKRDARGRDQLVGMSLGAFLVKGRLARQSIRVPLMGSDGRLRKAPGEQVVDMERIRAAAADVRRTLDRTVR